MKENSKETVINVGSSDNIKYFNRFKDSKLIKLNLGCGADHKDGWINIDSGDHFGTNGLDIIHDLSQGIPFPSNSVDYIFHEHFIEHLTREQGLTFSKECFRVLKPGGVLRIACPDLRQLVTEYLTDKMKSNKSFLKYCSHWMDKTNAEILNLNMREWGHQYLYDKEEITKLLMEAGFLSDEISEKEVGQSNLSVLSGIETRDESLVVEACCYKQNERCFEINSDSVICDSDIMVSVVVLTYNHGKYIAETIESCLMQQCDFKFEVLIGEDCSTDDTLSIIEHYQKNNLGIIRVVKSDENVGGAKNFIRTANLCRGKYIAMCEGDDYWIDPFKLQKQVSFLESNQDYSICFHPVLLRLQEVNRLSNDTMTVDVDETTMILDLARNNYIHTPSVMYRNKFLNGVPKELSDSLLKVVAGDYLIHLFYAQYGKIKKMTDVMAVYRIHKNGIWSCQPLLDKQKSWVKALDLIMDYYPVDVRHVLRAQRDNMINVINSSVSND